MLGEHNKHIKIQVNLTSEYPCGHTISPLSPAFNSVVVRCCPEIDSCNLTVKNLVSPDFALCSGEASCPASHSLRASLNRLEGSAEVFTNSSESDNNLFDSSSAVGLESFMVGGMAALTVFLF